VGAKGLCSAENSPQVAGVLNAFKDKKEGGGNAPDIAKRLDRHSDKSGNALRSFGSYSAVENIRCKDVKGRQGCAGACIPKRSKMWQRIFADEDLLKNKAATDRFLEKMFTFDGDSRIVNSAIISKGLAQRFDARILAAANNVVRGDRVHRSAAILRCERSCPARRHVLGSAQRAVSSELFEKNGASTLVLRDCKDVRR
jgi:hypothetical protein